jgi:competence protein ComGF
MFELKSVEKSRKQTSLWSIFFNMPVKVLTAKKTFRERASERLQISQDPNISTLESEEAKRLIRELRVHQLSLLHAADSSLTNLGPANCGC